MRDTTSCTMKADFLKSTPFTGQVGFVREGVGYRNSMPPLRHAEGDAMGIVFAAAGKMCPGLWLLPPTVFGLVRGKSLHRIPDRERGSRLHRPYLEDAAPPR